MGNYTSRHHDEHGYTRVVLVANICADRSGPARSAVLSVRRAPFTRSALLTLTIGPALLPPAGVAGGARCGQRFHQGRGRAGCDGARDHRQAPGVGDG
eukprot:6439936-Pyramimonas_sp.AAC.1